MNQPIIARSKVFGVVGALALATVIGAGGCATQSRMVPPTPAFIKLIGVAVYPRATPLAAQDTTVTSGVGSAEQLSATFTTHDSRDRVAQFYEKVLPKTKRSSAVPFVNGIAYNFFIGANQKEVLLVTIKDETMITLQTTNIATSKPTPTPSPGVPGS